MEIKSVVFKNKEVFYRKAGSGKPVMLVHGFAEDGSIFDNLVEDLSKSMLLIIPDLPGSGQSAFNEQLSSMEDFAEALHMIITAEELKQCNMIGHSMGGYITLAFAERHPEMLTAFGLFHSSALADDEEKIATRRKGIRFIREHGSQKFLNEATPKLFSDITNEQHPEIIAETLDKFSNFDPNALVQYYDAMITRPDRRHVLKNARKSVLLILGQHDNAVPFNKGLEQAHIPEICYIHVCKTSGHMGMLEEPEFCIRAVQEFVEQA